MRHLGKTKVDKAEGITPQVNKSQEVSREAFVRSLRCPGNDSVRLRASPPWNLEGFHLTTKSACMLRLSAGKTCPPIIPELVLREPRATQTNSSNV